MLKHFLKDFAAILLSLLLVSNCWAGINFDGTDDLVNCGDVDITGGITIYVWVNGDIWGTTSTYAGIVAKRPAATTANYVLDVDAGAVGKDEVRFYFNDGNWHIWNSNNADFANGISYHIVITYDQTNDAIIYKNGSTVGVTRSAGTASGTLTANTGNLYIGWQEADNAYWDGRISEVAIWNVVLSVAEIELLYNSKIKGMPLQIQPANLKLYLPMDDQPDGTSADGDTVKDLSGNGNNGTGDNGANNTGLTWAAEQILSTPSQILMGQ